MSYLGLTRLMPAWANALLAVLSAALLILAFPDFDYWFLAWFALVPLLWAIERETVRTESVSLASSGARSFVLGWIFGTVFFYGTCWWLTFAPITYASFPPILAYTLMFFVAAGAGIFPGIFALILAIRVRQIGVRALGDVPLIWISAEFLRYWLTGNNWNAIGYSTASFHPLVSFASWGGVYLVGFLLVSLNAGFLLVSSALWQALEQARTPRKYYPLIFGPPVLTFFLLYLFYGSTLDDQVTTKGTAAIIAIQPNVPMEGMNLEKWNEYRRNHVRLAQSALQKLPADNRLPTTVVFPESPMNFMYEDDPSTREFLDLFTAKNNVSVLFNSAEPNHLDGKYYNSAVLVAPDGRVAAQYDKIHLLPFGETVPFPLEGLLPGFVGNFSFGREYDLLPLGDARAGVMICWESHFGVLSREYVRNGADVLIEMTNDGYLGPTPVLRQHLANAVFRAVETNRPLLRVTNVGITAYITEKGEVLDPAPTYQEDSRIWPVSKSDGSQTFYVKYGDWFAWVCSIVTLGLLILGYSYPPDKLKTEK